MCVVEINCDALGRFDGFMRHMDSRFPSPATVYEYFVNPSLHSWIHWESRIPGSFRCSPTERDRESALLRRTPYIFVDGRLPMSHYSQESLANKAHRVGLGAYGMRMCVQMCDLENRVICAYVCMCEALVLTSEGWSGRWAG